ncbi:GNAT family N-acetyltransferase, partial [Streptomyces sp. NPDC059456]
RAASRDRLAEAVRVSDRAGVRLLVRDTDPGRGAERVYRSAGWTEAGTIPDYATDPAGRLHPTTLFFKQLGPPR